MRLALVTLLGVALLAGCASPGAVIRLEPRGDPTWSDGRAFVSAEQDSLRATIAFERSTSAYLVFDVQVENRSAAPLRVTPEEFRCAAPHPGVVIPALDPELEIQRVDQSLSRLEAARKSDLGWAAAGAALDLVSLFVEFGHPETGAEQKREEERRRDSDQEEARAAFVYERGQAEMEGERRMWSECALRRTTLGPGDSRRGLVFFPRPSSPQRSSECRSGSWTCTRHPPRDRLATRMSTVVHVVAGTRHLAFEFQSSAPTSPRRAPRLP